jgi:hypothetical protein
MMAYVQWKRSDDCLPAWWLDRDERASDLPSGPPSSRPLTLRCRAYRPSLGWSGADGAGGVSYC